MNITAETITKQDLTGSGSASDPYIVHSTRGFLWLSNKTISKISLYSKYVKLACDIVLNEEQIDNDGNITSGDGVIYNWKPISTAEKMSFEGNNFCIYGLYCSRDTNYASLFHSAYLEEIKNLDFSDIYIYNSEYYAQVIGYNCGKIENCNVRKGLIAGNLSVAGFARTATLILNCKNYANVVSETNYAAGFAYNVRTKIANCENYGNISAFKDYAAGLVSGNDNNKLKIEYVRNFGRISCARYGGGIISSNYLQTKSIEIRNCRNYGEIEGILIGGMIGYSCGICTISNCQNYGDVKKGKLAGGMVGQIYDNSRSGLVVVKVTNCKNFVEKGSCAFIGIATNETNVFLEDCYAEIKGYVNTDSFLINDIGIVNRLELMNLQIKIIDNKNKEVTATYHSSTENYENILFKNICVEVDNDANFYIIRKGDNLDNSLLNVESCIMINSSNGTYYGSDFSGYYVDFKTGKIGLKSLSGKGFFQGEVSEDVLLSKGYTKKTI